MGRKGNATREDTSRFGRRMKRKAERILSLEASVLEKKEEVDRAARRQVLDKQHFLSGNCLKSWRTGFNFLKASDKRNRPCDQQLPARSYSVVDNEVWQMTEMRRWFDSHSSPQAPEGFNPLTSGYTVAKNGKLPPLMRTQRVPTPAWAVAEDINKMAASHQKRDEAESLRELQDLHFSDFEGNLGIQRARAGVLVSRMKPPKGWGPQHTHVTGFRSPPWKERPPQEASRYKSPETLRDRDLFIQPTAHFELHRRSLWAIYVDTLPNEHHTSLLMSMSALIFKNTIVSMDIVNDLQHIGEERRRTGRARLVEIGFTIRIDEGRVPRWDRAIGVTHILSY
eukprot:jgi/Undpi1/11863/HiC_scaffold_4.g01562.m1